MYRVNEIFYSLQGEGFWTGTPMVFLRFSGCNLRCPFCDTDHAPYSEMSLGDILEAVSMTGKGCRRICLTGGEPTLQADSPLISALHGKGYLIHIETNGTRPLPEGIDWVTLSPKSGLFPDIGKVVIGRADELKVVFSPGDDPSSWLSFPATHHFLQPCYNKESGGSCNSETAAYILAHPSWRLSLQTHRLLGIK